MQIFKLSLYGTSACHLCEQATDILQEVSLIHIEQNDTPVMWQEIDIVHDDALMERYELTIPVLSIENSGLHAELNWPFAKVDVLKFLAANTPLKFS